MTVTPCEASLSLYDWEVWASDVEETLTLSLKSFLDVDAALADANQKLANHRAFFDQHNPEFDQTQSDTHWSCLLNDMAEEILTDLRSVTHG